MLPTSSTVVFCASSTNSEEVVRRLMTSGCRINSLRTHLLLTMILNTGGKLISCKDRDYSINVRMRIGGGMIGVWPIMMTEST